MSSAIFASLPFHDIGATPFRRYIDWVRSSRSGYRAVLILVISILTLAPMILVRRPYLICDATISTSPFQFALPIQNQVAWYPMMTLLAPGRHCPSGPYALPLSPSPVHTSIVLVAYVHHKRRVRYRSSPPLQSELPPVACGSRL